MDKDTKLNSSSHCFGCLAESNNSNLEVYHLQGVSLQSVLQTNQLVLCYICIKLVKNTERFIHNVETAQYLLKETGMKCDNIRAMMKPLILTATILDQDNLIEFEEYEEKVKVEVDYDKEIPVTEDTDTEIKQELSDDNFIDAIVPLDDNVDSFVNSIENEFHVKDEEDISLIKVANLKETKRKMKRKKVCSKKPTRTKNIKIKNEPAGEEGAKIETVYLTKGQCLEERAQRRLNSQYINRLYKCESCIKGFSFKPSYDKHMENHRKMTGEFKCEYCNQCYVTEENLKGHLKCHTVRYKCTVCDFTRVSRPSVSQHIALEHGAGLACHQCPRCGKTMKGKCVLRYHLFRCRNTRRVRCEYCSKEYAGQDSLRQHQMRKHPAEVQSSMPAKYVCKECGMAFVSPSALKIHTTKHSHRRDFYCVECDKSFKTNNSLQQHLNTVSVHITNEKLIYPCPLCNKRFTMKSHAERHTRDVHVKAARYYCDQCGKKYTCKYKLADHLRKHDGYEKPRSFICSICSKAFQAKRILHVHMRIHTGEKPFCCPQCPAQFNQYGSLYNHKRLVHKIVGKANKRET
ncbi:zinc-finger double domain-containing protein [Phthorimaea operculella]|nr:zinc-finger double domain-containing protein [Phthorimaea operculella]